MNRADFNKQFSDELEEMYNIMIEKNADYADGEDPFKNFRLVEQLGIADVSVAILVRMADKISRISNLISTEAKVKDESIADTLIDLANYSVILSIYLSNEEQAK